MPDWDRTASYSDRDNQRPDRRPSLLWPPIGRKPTKVDRLNERLVLASAGEALSDRQGRLSVARGKPRRGRAPPPPTTAAGAVVNPTCCCIGRSYNKTLLRSAIFMSPESTLTMGGFRWQIAVRGGGHWASRMPIMRRMTMRSKSGLMPRICPSLVHPPTITPPALTCRLALRSRTRK